MVIKIPSGVSPSKWINTLLNTPKSHSLLTARRKSSAETFCPFFSPEVYNIILSLVAAFPSILICFKVNDGGACEKTNPAKVKIIIFFIMKFVRLFYQNDVVAFDNQLYY